jgi:biopolymer transport protein ExbD
MAELANNFKKGKTRFHEKNTRVDLTPMVDLGFLLISFFVFTTTLSQPTVMKLDMPNDKDTLKDPVCESCVLTVLLGKNNRIKYYEGSLGNKPRIGETTFSPGGIREVITEKKRAVKAARGREEAFILIIKPSDASTFQNFVDMADEVTINNIRRYYIDELTGDDKRLLER